MSSFRRGTWYTVLVVLLLTVTPLQRTTEELTTIEAVLAASSLAAAVISILAVIYHGKLRRKLWPYIGFGLLLLANVFIAYPGVSLMAWVRRVFPLVSFVALAVAIPVVASRLSEVKRLYTAIVAISVLVCGVGTLDAGVQLAQGAPIISVRQAGAGYYSAFGLSLLFPFILDYRQLETSRTVLVAAAAVLLFSGLILSFTRTYWLSTAFAIAFAAGMNRSIRVGWGDLARGGAVAAALIGVVLLLVPPVRSLVVSRILSFGDLASSLSVLERLYEARGLLDAATDSIWAALIGNGLGSEYSYYSVNPFTLGGVGVRWTSYSHNYYLYLLWTTGLLGLATFLLMMAGAVRHIIDVLRRPLRHPLGQYATGILAAIVNVLVCLLAAPPLANVKWTVYFGVLVGVAFSIDWATLQPVARE